MRGRSTTGSSTGRMLLAVVASLGANVIGVAALGPLLGAEPGKNIAADDLHVVALVPIDEVARELADQPEPSGQFVSLPEPAEEVRPDEADFFDRYDRSAERETVARDDLAAVTGDSPPVPSSGAPSPRPSATGSPEDTLAMAAPSPSRRRASADEERPTEGNTPGPDPDEHVADETDETRDPRDDGSGGGPGDVGASTAPRRLDLRGFNPTAESAAAALRPVGGRTDHLELEEGDRTLLNSHRTIYWAFFNRMKEQVRLEWDPVRVYRRHDPTGQLYGAQDRYTVLTLTLNSDGTLRNALVSRSSELDFLDREALRALQAAAPFRNVPEGLKDENGLLTTNFGFLFSIDSRRARIHRIERM